MKKTALITGGAKRIGKGIALALADRGYQIALHYNHSARDAKEVQRLIQKEGGRCAIFPCDFHSEEETQQLIPMVKKKFPSLNLLINNASLFQKTHFDGRDLHAFNAHFAVNLKAPYILSCEFARLCQEGDIINIIDTHITQNKTDHGAYLLFKKSLFDLTKLMAVAFAPRIRVNAIAPGLILPPENKQNGYLKRLSQKVPLRRKGNLTTITSSLDCLLNTDYLTGQMIYADGGEHLL